jgi:hypothetical protein
VAANPWRPSHQHASPTCPLRQAEICPAYDRLRKADGHITAGNPVAKVIDTPLRNDLILVEEIGFAPLDDTGTQLPFRQAPQRHLGVREFA